MSDGKRILSKEPWWAAPPEPGQQDADLAWGYLIVYEGGRIVFDQSETPSEAEIKERKACRIRM